VRFEIPEFLIEVLRGRRTDPRTLRAAVRPRHGRATPAPSLVATIRKLFSSSKSAAEPLAAQYVDGMNQLQDEVEHEHDAFLLDPGMGPMAYLTADGRVLLDMRSWDGDSIREATDDEAIAVLVVGAKKTSIVRLLDLIPTNPSDALVCAMCSGTRWYAFLEHRVVCLLCSGRGRATPEQITRAQASGTWPVRKS
jgi:hypothetical protein